MPRLLSALLAALAVLVTGAGLAWACTPDGTSDEPAGGWTGPPPEGAAPAAPQSLAPATSPGGQGPSAAPQAQAETGTEARIVSEGPTRALSAQPSSARRPQAPTGPAAGRTGSGPGATTARGAEADTASADRAASTAAQGERSGGRDARSPASERSAAAELRGGLLSSSPTVANTATPAAAPGGQLSLGLALLGIGAVGLSGALLAAVARRRRPAAAPPRHS